MDSLMQDVRFALRTLAKAPLFTTLCILCLAIGIGLNANIYSAVYAVFQRPFPFANPEQLVAFQERNLKRGFENQATSYENFKDFRDQSTAVELAGYSFRSITITDGQEPVRLQGEQVSWNLLSMLGVQPHIGRTFRKDEDQKGAPDVIVLGYGVWSERYAADSAIIGRTLPVNGLPHTVIGVMPPGFMFPEREEAWIPIAPRLDGKFPRDWRDVVIVGRLKDGADVDAATAQLEAVSKRLATAFPEAQGDWLARVVPMRDAFIDGDTKLVIAAMMGAVTFVLLIACANVANLLLARATGRGREIAVRTALGAGRGRIVRQMLTESIILALVAVPLGIAVAYWLLDIILASIPDGDMPYYFVFEINGIVLLYTVLIGVATGVVFGLAPALQASRGSLVTALKDGGRGSSGGGKRQRLRTALAVGEIALSMVLLVGAALFVKSFMNLRTKNGGIDTTNLMTMRFFMPGTPYDSGFAINNRVDDVIRRVEALPGVVSATASNLIPLSGGGAGGQFEVEGKPAANRADAPFARWTGATAHWFGTLGVPLVAGRALTDDEARDRSTVAVINESMARKFWPEGNAVGSRFRQLSDLTNTWYTVVGVSRDYHPNELDNPGPIEPMYVMSYRHMPTRNTGLMIRTTAAPAQITSAVRKAIRDSDPGMPVFEVATMEEVRQLGFWAPKLFGWMFAMFGLVALLLASVGVYGVIAYGVSQRTQEIGVRLALGAQPADVVRLVVRGGAMLAFMGIAIGLLGAFGVTRVIQSLLIDVSSHDPMSFIGVTLFLTAIALFASYVPARRATRVDPLTALRAE